MEHFEIKPLVGIGPVRLGMTREESRRAMGRTPDSFQKSPTDPPTTDAYFESAFQVFFDEHDRVEYIELSGPAAPFAALYRGKDVHRASGKDVVALVSKDGAYDPDDPELGSAYLFPSLELSLWRPEADEPFFATVGIGRRGYFSQQ